jgi:thiol-disulfide isomerase/thioredoxin
MSKNFSLYTFIIFISFLILIFSSEEGKNNTQIPKNESKNNTESSKHQENSSNKTDLFKDFDMSNILHIDSSNFSTEIQKNEYLFILFYAPWCEQCKTFIPIYLDTAKYCKENNISVAFSKIDATESNQIARGFRIRDFPSIFFLNKGNKFLYNGIRTKEAFISFIKRKMNSNIIKIEKLEELNTIQNMYNTSIIFLSTIKNTSSSIYNDFQTYANLAMFMDFVSCVSEECLKKYGEDIILFKAYDEKENSYSKDFGKLEEANYETLRYFTSIYAVEAGAYLRNQEINFLYEFKKNGLFYVRNSSKLEDTKYDSFFKKLGKELRSYNIYSFICSSDTKDPVHVQTLNGFSIINEELPGIFYYDTNTGDPILRIKIYSIKNVDMKKIDINYIKNFLKDIKEDKVRRDLFSEKPSQSRSVNGVKYVIGRTFDEDILNSKDNVLLGMILGHKNDKKEFNFLNILENLAKKYQNEKKKNIKFKVMNVNKNEPRDINVYNDDFPRAYLFTNAMENKEMIRYEPKNNSTEIVLEELDDFISEKLKWKNDTINEKKEIKKDKDEKKSEEKEGKQTDL